MGHAFVLGRLDKEGFVIIVPGTVAGEARQSVGDISGKADSFPAVGRLVLAEFAVKVV